MINSRTLKVIAVVYAVKAVLLGLAWVMVPDLPARAAQKARQTWAAMASRSTPPAETSR